MLSFKAEHLRRYKDIALLLFKYGRSDVVHHAGLSELLPEDHPNQSPEGADTLAADVEKLGPTFIKLGQLLSTRPDIVPPAYARALKRLQDDCEPFPYEEVEAIVEAELGVRVSKVFEGLDPVPLAAASIAQVHHATLRDGREVAVKVQRPGIRERVLADLDALAEVSQFLERRTEFGQRFAVIDLFEQFRKSILRELDFRLEAMHLVTIGRNLAEIPEIMIPRPVMDFSTSRVLTMQYIPGTKVTELSPLALLELDGERLADALFRAYLKQMLRDGFFHADPHPGNVFLYDGRIALLDLGMVARVTPALQDRLLQLLLAVAENRPEDASKALLTVAECRDGANLTGFQRGVADLVAQNQEVTIERPQVGRAVLALLKVAGENGVRLPPELAMIGKTLLNLDEIGMTLAPKFDPNAAIRKHAAGITEEQVLRDFSVGSLFSTAVEAKNFVQQLPGRVNRILDRLADNSFEIRVNALDEEQLVEGFQKVANRIALGLILAALIVGAALMMDVPTTFTIFGYPGIAMLLFLAAAAGGIALAVTILANDIRAQRKR